MLDLAEQWLMLADETDNPREAQYYMKKARQLVGNYEKSQIPQQVAVSNRTGSRLATKLAIQDMAQRMINEKVESERARLGLLSPAMTYRVPEQYRDRLGDYYLTNMVMPEKASTPSVNRLPLTAAHNGEPISAPLPDVKPTMPESNIDWARLAARPGETGYIPPTERRYYRGADLPGGRKEQIQNQVMTDLGLAKPQKEQLRVFYAPDGSWEFANIKDKKKMQELKQKGYKPYRPKDTEEDEIDKKIKELLGEGSATSGQTNKEPLWRKYL